MTYQPCTVWVGGKSPYLTHQMMLRQMAKQQRERLLDFITKNPGRLKDEIVYAFPDIPVKTMNPRIAELVRDKLIKRNTTAVRCGSGVRGIIYAIRHTPVKKPISK